MRLELEERWPPRTPSSVHPFEHEIGILEQFSCSASSFLRMVGALRQSQVEGSYVDVLTRLCDLGDWAMSSQEQ